MILHLPLSKMCIRDRAKTAGKAEAKKPAVRRTAKKAAVAAEEIFIQYAGKEFTTKDVVANVKKAWTEMTGKKEEDIQEMCIRDRIVEKAYQEYLELRSAGLWDRQQKYF